MIAGAGLLIAGVAAVMLLPSVRAQAPSTFVLSASKAF
jgi:hypothetical protein